jgi:membrane protease YdiL (CAAX protease family)
VILRIVVYYVLTLFFTFLIGGLQQEAGLLPGLTFLPQWGPGIAGLFTMLAFYKRDKVRITFFDPKMPPLRYLWAFLLPLGAVLLAYLFALVALGRPDRMSLSVGLVASMVAGAIGEEIGWRGYLHRRIAPHMSGLLSSAIVGVLWTPFHVHLLSGGVLFLLFFGLSNISLSAMAHATLSEYRYNVLGATLFHVAINLGSTLTFALVQRFDLRFMIAYGLVAALVAAVVVLLRRDLFLNRPGR